MTDEEIQALQQSVIELREKQRNYELDKQSWESERSTLSQQLETLKATADTYKDMNAKLSLNLATQMTSNSGTGELANNNQTEQDDNTISLEDILKDL